MSNATDDREDDEHAAEPYGEGLWADVRYWLDAILGVFGDLKALAHVGITRSLAVKLCNWLWGVEGAIRRLILAEALKLDQASPGAARPGSTNGSTVNERKPRAAGRRRPSFRVFGFIGPGEGAAPAASLAASLTASPAARTDLPRRWHIRFPSDSLLSMGERLKQRRAASLRRINPLDRRGLSRADPDYWLHREEVDPFATGFRSPGWSSGRPSRPKPEPLALQDRPGYLAANSDPSDWRRVEEEWKRVIPAPHLAARIFAVVGILERREQAVRRMARYFARCRTRIADILAQPFPELAWPKRARSIYRSREAEALALRSHAELLCLDTS